MQSIIRAAVVALITTSLALAILAAGATAAPRHHHPHHRHRHRRVRLPADYQAWTRVAMCESGGWQVLGTATGPYPDALGISATNYRAFGGRPDGHGPLTLRQRVAEIRVADRFRAHYRIPVPDQGGCASW